MNKKIALVVSVVSVAVALTLAFATFPGFGQERNRTVNSTAPETSLTKKEALIVEKNAPTAVTSVASTVSPVWAQAATQNSSLRTGLNWLFGGKQQHGWYLYSGLIGQLLQTDRDSGAPEFALALSSWQQKTGLAPTGILDGDTLYKMVDTWQSIRSKDHTYPSPDQLITAPPSEFLHPERPAELRQVQREAYAAYKRMLAAAIADPSLKLKATPDGELAPEEQFFKIVSAFRSREYQEQLRRQNPKAGSAGLAINSPHFTGRALDLYVGGDPVDTADANRAIQVNTPAYKWLVKNARSFGFYPYYYEPWHWEYKPGSVPAPAAETQTASTNQ